MFSEQASAATPLSNSQGKCVDLILKSWLKEQMCDFTSYRTVSAAIL